MTGRTASDGARRVIVLSADRECIPAENAGAPYVCTFVTHPYQAAAEVLTGAVAALVVDLRMLPGRHRRLLQIARNAGAEVLAIGALPAGLQCDELSGVRLVAKADLPGLLKQTAERVAAVAAQPEPSPSPVPGPTEDEDLTAVARQEIEDASTDESSRQGDLCPPTPPSMRVEVDLHLVPAKSPGKTPPAPDESTVTHPVGLLSDEELTALLENEQ